MPRMSKAKEPAPNAPKKGFDERLAELDQIVLEIESGELGLEASMARYQAGVALQRELARELEEHRRRFQELSSDGTLTPHPADERLKSDAGPGAAAG